MTLDRRISFIGAGNMASALISGLLAARTSEADQILACDVRAEALAELARTHGVKTTTDSAEAAGADVVVLSVKPQTFPALLPELSRHIDARASLVISIAAGVPIAAIEACLPSGTRVVRAMPNTPALVSAGATALSAGKNATNADLAIATEIFRSVGVVVTVPEDQMDAVTALSGSGPAYVFLMTEALVDAGVRVGLARDVAAQLARQTVYGAGKLLMQSTESPEDLRRRVTSPGGTTHAGITKLETHGLRDAMNSCLEAARDRGQELGKEAAAKLIG